MAVVVPGLVLASPAVVAYLRVAEQDKLAAYPSWWIGVALAPVVAYLVVWLAARKKVHPQHRTHLDRAGLLTGVCTAAALLALVLDLIYLDGKVPGRAPRSGAGSAVDADALHRVRAGVVEPSARWCACCWNPHHRGDVPPGAGFP